MLFMGVHLRLPHAHSEHDLAMHLSIFFLSCFIEVDNTEHTCKKILEALHQILFEDQPSNIPKASCLCHRLILTEYIKYF